jgi:hypothetical protein
MLRFAPLSPRFLPSLTKRTMSSAFCLRSLSLSVDDLYSSVGYRVNHDFTPDRNLFYCIGNLHRINIKNAKIALDRICPKELGKLFSSVDDFRDLYYVTSTVQDLVFSYLSKDQENLKKICKTPHDLIFAFEKGWMPYFLKSTLQGVINNQRDLFFIMNMANKSREELLPLLGLSHVKKLILQNESDKDNIQPVLNWLKLMFYYDPKKERHDFLFNFLYINKECMIGNYHAQFRGFRDLLLFFNSYGANRDLFSDLLGSYMKKHVPTLVSLLELVKLIDKDRNKEKINNEILFEKFSEKEINQLIVTFLQKNPDIKYMDFMDKMNQVFHYFNIPCDITAFEHLQKIASEENMIDHCIRKRSG